MKVSYEPVESGFHVRLMSPLGRYPPSSFIGDSAALVVSPEVCFSVVRVKARDWGFSEIDGLTPAEIPLLGSILLSGEAGEPYVYPYPSGYHLMLEAMPASLDERCVSEGRELLLSSLKNNEGKELPSQIIHLPPVLGGSSYSFVDSGADGERRANLRHLEGASPLLLRGVALLLKAHMAWQHPELCEAACLFLWICLDAAHSLVLERLRERGVANPSSRDAAKWFEEVSGYDKGWEKFFEDDYENRIRAMHPDNRFGAEARPQFLADDFLELNDLLVPLFHHLISK